jgi:hypothetical protein
MPATVQTLASDVLRVVRGQATYYQVRKAIEDALKWIDQQANWEFLHKETNLNVEAPYSTGTVSVTAGATAVTGAATVWSVPWKYKTIKLTDRQMPYAVASFGSAITLTLGSALSGSTNISGGTYQIYQRRYALPTDCEPGRDLFIRGPMGTGPDADGIIVKKGKLAFDRISDPRFTAGRTVYYTDDEYDQVNYVPTIAMYPFPTLAGEYFLSYYTTLTIPTLDSDRVMIPPAFEAAVVKLAAANVKLDNGSQGWLALQQQGQEMVRALFVRFGASAAYDNRPEMGAPRDMFASDSLFYTN